MKNEADFLQPLASWVFIISALLFSTNQLVLLAGIQHTFLSGYVDDILVIPIVLSLTTILIRFFTKNPSFRIDLGMLITSVILFSIAFEWLLPRLSDRYTADFLDVLCYCAGAILYYCFRDS